MIHGSFPMHEALADSSANPRCCMPWNEPPATDIASQGCMHGIPEATPIILTEAERTELEALARSRKTECRLRQRARIVLAAADGMASRAIGQAVGCTTGTASKWRVRYAEKRLAGLDETGNRGAEPKYTAATNKRILAQLDRPPPEGYARWTGPLVAVALGDVDVQYIWRFLRAQKIDLAGRKSWCESNDPQFAAKAADVVGLYLAPHENAIVICVDEKPSIQALERTQGYLKLPNGRALTGHSQTTSAMALRRCLPPSSWRPAR
jgi:transposase